MKLDGPCVLMAQAFHGFQTIQAMFYDVWKVLPLISSTN